MEGVQKLLCDIGFAGIRRGVGEPPELIFDTLEQLRPDNACGRIGKALIQVNKGNFDTAISMLERSESVCTTAVEQATEIREMVENLKQETFQSA